MDEFLKLPLGRHLCCIYGTKHDQFSVVIPYFLVGLKRQERCIYIIDERTIEEVVQAFQRAGVDLEPYIQSKKFIFLTKEDAYLKNGFFEPGRMIALLKLAQKEALRAGFKGLRVTGEMTWILTKLPGVEKFVEYESKLNYFFPKSKSIAICQYNEKKFSASALLDVIYTHPIVVIHKTVCDNHYYVPPNFFLAKLKGHIRKEVYKGVYSDLIERAVLEKRHKEAERRVKDLSMFPAQNPNPIVRMSSDGKVLYANAAGRLLTRVFKQDQIRFLRPFEEKVKKSIEDRRVTEMELNMADKVYLVVIAPVKSRDYANIYALDITVRKKAEQQAEEFANLKTKFASTASHELRGTISMVQEGVSLVYDGIVGSLQDKQKETLGTVLKAVKRLTRLVNDILDFQKMLAGREKFDFKKWNIKDVIQEIYETMHFLAEQKGLYFNIKIPKDLPLIRFDRDKIIQVLVNLVNNALNFTEKGGIEIAVGEEKGQGIHVSVRDSGLGIKEDGLPKVFQSFQQLELEGERAVKGSGLGLAISKEIIDAHQGEIWVESELGKGSVFHFILPFS